MRVLVVEQPQRGILLVDLVAADVPGTHVVAIREMIATPHPVIFDCVVDQAENCFPMIPSGRAHNEMLLGDAAESLDEAITEEGKMLV